MLGLIIGSFLNVVIYRLPIMLKVHWERECQTYLKQTSTLKHKLFNLFVPRSHCPHCETQIPLWLNIPLISYVFLRGKCHNCGAKISLRYPLVEILSCFASIVVAWRFGCSWQMLAALGLTWALIPLIFIDFDLQLLPDEIVLPLIWMGIFLNIFGLFNTLEHSVLGAICGYLSLWLVGFVFQLIRKVEGMGHGDFKLFAVFGAWLGFEYLPLIILGASLFGSIIGGIFLLAKKYPLSKPIPFGPYLIAAGWAMILWGKTILGWYLQFIRF
ncbi:MAG: A24 family peptidase [Gammaproteobacteria bacterium]|nr:A24 family peptidase [Gammaproteobacteria bacterium]